jgi:glucose/arabinose dehydrogenase
MSGDVGPAGDRGKRRRRRLGIAIGAAGVVALLGAGFGAAWYFGLIFTYPSVRGQPVDVPDTAVQTIATNLEIPWAVAFLPDVTALVTERGSGRILSVRAPAVDAADSVAQVSEVARIPDVRPGGEGGLLGIAVSPGYAADSWVYVYYTAASDNRVARLRPGGPIEPILTGIPKAGNHNGGRIAFGPDGMLYIGTGDAGRRDESQDPSSLAGKILRITADGAPAPGNPFGDSPVYSLGHRNVQGLAWDAGGQLFATEFGQNRYDELNRIEPGRNYGWPRVEGMGDDPAFVNPVATWTTSDASPSGLAILDGRAYVACLRGTKLYRIDLDGTNGQQLLSGRYGRLRSATVAPDGTLWLTTSNRDGRGDPATTDDRVLRLLPDRVPG